MCEYKIKEIYIRNNIGRNTFLVKKIAITAE